MDRTSTTTNTTGITTTSTGPRTSTSTSPNWMQNRQNALGTVSFGSNSDRLVHLLHIHDPSGWIPRVPDGPHL